MNCMIVEVKLDTLGRYAGRRSHRADKRHAERLALAVLIPHVLTLNLYPTI